MEKQRKPDWGIFVGIVGIVLAILVPVLQANGVNVNWQISLVMYGVLTSVCVWSFLKHGTPHRKRWVRWVGSIVLIGLVGGLGTYATNKQWTKEQQTKSIGETEKAVQQPAYPPPSGPGIHMTGVVEPASSQMCQGLSDKEQVKCLCPNPLAYTLRAMASPADDNYATEIDIKQGETPIYRLRIFARTQMGTTEGFATLPFGPKQAASAVGQLEYDRASLILHSSAPQNEYKITVHSAEGLRLKCINQEN